MNEALFKSFVALAVGLLASTVKNPTSAKARKLRKYVEQLNEATGQFLEAVPEE